MKEKNQIMSAIVFPFLLLSIFIGMSLFMWKTTKNTLFLFDLPYIGFSIFTGLLLFAFLPKKHIQWGRCISQLLVGFYFIFFLGIVTKVNMQLEGFFFCLFMGIFYSAVLHYAIAKIFGPFIFNRGFCGWACWTAMVLDFLPWKNPGPRIRRLGILRYIHFLLSFITIFVLYFIIRKFPENYSWQVVAWTLIGNAVYFIIGFTLAWFFKDNRAFCKYICPITVILKNTARFSLFKLSVNQDKCIKCGACEKTCPMNIRILEYANEGKRNLSTECILCFNCQHVCESEAIEYTAGLDAGWKEKLNIQKSTNTAEVTLQSYLKKNVSIENTPKVSDKK
jgi:ferredoxin-type protein NapH